jgi:hypothetical protein
MSQRRGPGWLGVLLGSAVGFLVGVVLIVALGGVVHDHTRTVTHTTKAPAPKVADGIVLPDLVGTELDDAENQLGDLGLHYDVNGGGTFGVIDASNWDVVQQVPSGHATVQEGSVVELDIERN